MKHQGLKPNQGSTLARVGTLTSAAQPCGAMRRLFEADGERHVVGEDGHAKLCQASADAFFAPCGAAARTSAVAFLMVDASHDLVVR